MVKINHQLWGQLNKVKGESTLNHLETLSPAMNQIMIEDNLKRNEDSERNLLSIRLCIET